MNDLLLHPLGSYILLKQLAVGGMAEIFLALKFGPTPFVKRVVIKKLFDHCNNNREYIRLFYQEASIGAAIQHPNLLSIWDACPIQGHHAMVMDFLHGITIEQLWDFCKTHGISIPIPITLQIAIETARGLHALHTLCDNLGNPMNVVHRDLSPQNIFLSYNGNCKIFDYGVSQVGNQPDTSNSGMLIGKYAYMSPEQCHGKHLDARSDLFSFGVILYELLTQTPLFDGTNNIQMIRAVLSSPINRPSTLQPKVSPFLDRIVLKALNRSTALRYQSAQELEYDLQKCLKYDGYQQSNVTLQSFLSNLFAEKIHDFEQFWKNAVTQATLAFPPQDPLAQLAQPPRNAFDEDLLQGEELIPEELS